MPIVPLREEEVPFYTHIVADSDMDRVCGAALRIHISASSNLPKSFKISPEFKKIL